MIAGTNAHGNCATRESGRILSYKEGNSRTVGSNEQPAWEYPREGNK